LLEVAYKWLFLYNDNDNNMMTVRYQYFK
jgi:hypothetical protein